ncbi:MAG: rhodanese-like domain-containing protein [Chromatiales bacterium]|jgi:rhodanese-related sulfurtransferase|nr:rhodanese-like domain-containing protein [Chromatiales bacterium]
MENLGTFVLNNWLLFLALIVILALLFVNLTKSRLLGFKEVPPNEAVRLNNQENALFIDVRSDDEFAKGHIVDAIHVPLPLIDARVNDLQQYRDRKVIVYCESGKRAAHAAVALRKHGFTSVYKLTGGLMAWRSASLPLERKP